MRRVDVVKAASEIYLQMEGYGVRSGIISCPRCVEVVMRRVHDVVRVRVVDAGDNVLFVVSGVHEEEDGDYASMGQVLDVLTSYWRPRLQETPVEWFGEKGRMLLSPIADVAGQQLEDLAVVVDALVEHGFKLSEAVLKVRSMLVRLVKARKEDGGELFSTMGVHLLDERGELLPLGGILLQIEREKLTAEQVADLFGKTLAVAVMYLANLRDALFHHAALEAGMRSSFTESDAAESLRLLSEVGQRSARAGYNLRELMRLASPTTGIGWDMVDAFAMAVDGIKQHENTRAMMVLPEGATVLPYSYGEEE